jgi:hypothetical protein
MGMAVEPVTLVVTALAAGAAAGLTGTASTAITDAYIGLKTLLKRKFAGHGRDPDIVDAQEVEPGVWQARLEPLGGDLDEEVLVAATRLLTLVDPDGARVGKYVVDVRDAKGVQVGDGNTQTNTFS